MAIATKTKPKSVQHKKRVAAHHRQTKHYVKSYWPYLPIAAIVAGGIFINTLLNRPVAVLGAGSNLTQQALVESTNVDRSHSQLTPLQLSATLNRAAQNKANDMIAKNYWAHNTPAGQQPWAFMTQAGYQYQSAGENLAYGFDDAGVVLNAWMHSPEHRANVLDTGYSEVGFGIAQSENFLGHGPETIVVALYAKPTSATAVTPATTAPLAVQPVSRIEAMAGPAMSGLIVGIIGTMAVLLVLVRHGIAWRKLLNRGEMFVIQHPFIDISLVAVAMTTAILSQTTGFIH